MKENALINLVFKFICLLCSINIPKMILCIGLLSKICTIGNCTCF